MDKKHIIDKTGINELSLFIIDVDGTMTDSGVIYDNNGNELKRFSTRDFAGIMAAHYAGIKIMVVTGRECGATTRRMQEMKIDYVFQNVKNKLLFLKTYIEKEKMDGKQIGYIGDDLNDYAAMNMVGFKACPYDACVEIKRIADYISPVSGGDGVIQDVFRYILEKRDLWDKFVEDVVEKGY